MSFAINGFGRIGRAAFRILADRSDLPVIAVNDIAPADNLAYLLRYDSAYGRFQHQVALENDELKFNGSVTRMLSVKDPAELPWKDLGVKMVLECSGMFDKRPDLKKHLNAGAERVVLSAPAKDESIPTVVHGVNKADANERIISCASCTTNCITPLVEILDRRIGVKKATMTTIHAYTSSQELVDAPSKKIRRGRAAAVNFVPTSTGAAKATGKALPKFQERFDGVAVRAPLPVGSLADLVFVLNKNTSAEEVNNIFREESASDRYRQVVSLEEDPIVSSDIVGSPYATVVDAEMTQVVDGDLLKVMSWYDNEWGYAAQMIREAERIYHEELR